MTYTIFNKTTGLVVQTGKCPASRYDLQMRKRDNEVYGIVPFTVDSTRQKMVSINDVWKIHDLSLQEIADQKEKLKKFKADGDNEYAVLRKRDLNDLLLRIDTLEKRIAGFYKNEN